ncbi:Cytochrome b5 reductase 4, partial [Geodia barretti]
MTSGQQFLTVASANRRESEICTSAHSRHPGYSLFEWRKLCDSLPHSASQPLHISLAELSLHNTDGDCWTAIRGKVYNVTRFLKYHPGRKAQLMRGAGVDSTKIYDKVHSWVNEEAILQKFFCGYLTPGEGPVFNKFRVSSVESITHNTRLFALEPPPGMKFHVPVGQFVRLKASIKGETVVREYTPAVSIVDSNKEHLKLMIKIYPEGKMTQYLSTIQTGDPLLISEPAGSFCTDLVNSTKELVLIAAGTGLTPMTSILNIRYHQKKELQSTLLLFANKSEEDILWRDKLEQVCRLSPQFGVVHILSSPSSSWKGVTGKISLSLLATHLPQPLMTQESVSVDHYSFLELCGSK